MTNMYLHPAVTADCVVFGLGVKDIKVLFSPDVLPPQAFDHIQILQMGLGNAEQTCGIFEMM